jgi:TRAP-type transport system periplasmic protein
VNRRKWTGLTSLVAVVTLTAGCAGGTAETAAPEPEAEPAAEATVEERTIRVAHIYDPGHPVEVCGIPAVAAALEGTGITVESFPGGALGSENEIIEQVLDGTLDFAFAGAAFLSQYEPNVGVLDAPFAYRDVEHFTAVTQGPIGAELFDGLRAASTLDVFSTWYYGTRHLTSNVEVNSYEDLAGLKLRVPDAPLYLTAAEILGGVGTPIAFAELYVSLQQGVVDAQENPIPTIDGQKFYEVQDYLNLTGHMIQGVMMTSSDAVTASMTAEQVALIRDAAIVGAVAAGACIEEQEEGRLLDWEGDGTIIVNRDVDVASFQARAAEIIPNSDFPWIELYLAIQDS